jgi:hypothetical protein
MLPRLGVEQPDADAVVPQLNPTSLRAASPASVCSKAWLASQAVHAAICRAG